MKLLLIIFMFEIANGIRIGHMQPFGSHRPPTLCFDELDYVPQPHEFFNRFVTSRRPVVFRGAAENSAATRNWSVESLIEKYGDMVVRLESKNEKSSSIPVTNVGFGRDTIRHFASNYQSMDAYVISQIPIPMEADVSVPPCLRCGYFASSIQEVHMFIVGKGGKTMIHRDPYSNIHCLFNGTKDWILIPDRYEKYLYQSSSSKYEFGGYSEVDVDRVDMHRYSLIDQIEYSRINLRKGDCIFVPGSFWHQVRVNGEYNTAASIWFSRFFGHNLPDWSDCLNDMHHFTPLSKVNIIWRYSGGNVSLNQGHMDINVLRFILLLMAEENNDRISVTEFCRTMIYDDDKCQNFSTKIKKIFHFKDDIVTRREIQLCSTDELKNFIEIIDPTDPSNTDEHEYSVIEHYKIRNLLSRLEKKHVVTKQKFRAKFCALGGSTSIADQLFQLLDHNNNDIITKDEIIFGRNDVIGKFLASSQHNPAIEHKWYKFLKKRDLI